MNEEENVTLESITVSMHGKALATVFSENKTLAYGELIDSLKQEYGIIGFKRARTSFVGLVKLLTNVGVIVKEGKRYRYQPDKINHIKD